jgi:twitching motility two-component system response regulator PilG
MNPMNNVLIVDDEIIYLEFLKNGLQKYEDRFEVLTASNGEEAIEVLKREHISVLVTDLVMPKMDGLYLLAYMSNNHPQVPCIVMTGYGSSEIRKRADHEVIISYFEKPFDFNELAWAILEGLDRLDKGDFVEGVSVSGLLQLVEMEQKTCLLEVRCGEKKGGYFYFNEGILYNALYNDMEGEDVALNMIGWNQVNFRFKSLPKEDIKRRINRDLMSLIMEGTRLKDEKTAEENEPDPADAVKTEEIKDQGLLSLMDHTEEDELISQAVRLAEGHHFQQAQMKLAELLKANPRNINGWLWYSRVVRSMKAIESSLKNAVIISPKNPEVIEENKKFNLAENRVWTERVRHCPFCWSPMELTAVECYYCMSHLLIHEQFFTTTHSAKQEILKKAIERYTKVIQREKNAKAHYYLGIAHLNLEDWEQALDQLNETEKLAPENKVFAGQLKSLLNYLAAMESLSESESGLAESPPESVRSNKVLVVEDSAVTRKVITMTLGRRKGYDVILAKDGIEALARLNEERPGLVLLDIIMPGMDGYKVLSIMKQTAEFKDIPVIMLTARDKIADKIKGKMAGSSEYLTKPFDPDELLAKANKYLPLD